MHKAQLFRQAQKDKAVVCTACKHYCQIADGGTGLCGVRQNVDGSLFLLVYGKASAVNVDPVEKKPLFHFMPGTRIFSLGTIGCNFGCSFCQNYDVSQVARDLRVQLIKEKRKELMGVEVGKYGYELPPGEIVDICMKNNIKSIAYTYNEPVIFFEYIYDTAKLAKARGIKTVFVSNGYESCEALDKIRPYIDAMNIDLKAFTEEFYARVCKAKLEPVKETIKHARELGIWVEITTLVIPGKNDTSEELTRLAQFLASVDKDMPWHITAFHPDFQMKDTPATTQSTLIRGYDIGKKVGLRFVYVGNVHDEQRESSYCPGCNALLIRRDWYNVKIENFSLGVCQGCGYAMPGVWA